MRSFEEDPCGGEFNSEETMINLEEEEYELATISQDNDDPSIISQYFSQLSSMLPPGLPEDIGTITDHQETIIKRTIEQLEQLERHQANLIHELATRSSSVVDRVSSTTISMRGSSSTWSDRENDHDHGRNYNNIPTVKVIANEEKVLIKVQCKESKWILPRIADELYKFHLSILSTCSFPFDDQVNITIVTLKCHGLNFEVKDLETAVEALISSSLKNDLRID